jgi:hypothetical protein
LRAHAPKLFGRLAGRRRARAARMGVAVRVADLARCVTARGQTEWVCGVRSGVGRAATQTGGLGRLVRPSVKSALAKTRAHAVWGAHEQFCLAPDWTSPKGNGAFAQVRAAPAISGAFAQ